MADNKVKFGLSHVHVAFPSVDGESWETPIEIPGAVNLSLDASGDASDFYASNGKYFTQFKNNGYTGDLEVALFPDEILKEMLGWYVDEKGKLVEDADGTTKKFALMFQTEGDIKPKRTVLYDCEISRPSKTAATTESSITPETDTVSITVASKYFKDIDKNIVSASCYKGDEEYEGFFGKVVIPTAEASE